MKIKIDSTISKDETDPVFLQKIEMSQALKLLVTSNNKFKELYDLLVDAADIGEHIPTVPNTSSANFWGVRVYPQMSALSPPSNNCKLGGYAFYLAIFRQFSNQILIHLARTKIIRTNCFICSG